MKQKELQSLKMMFNRLDKRGISWSKLNNKDKKKEIIDLGIPITINHANKIYNAYSIKSFEDIQYLKDLVENDKPVDYDEVEFYNEYANFEQLRDEGYVVIGVHNGIFHCDDVAACACLDILLEYLYDNLDKNDVKKVAIVRTRNPEVLKKCSICVDVGGGMFDHHDGKERKKRKNGKDYASIGLIWKVYGKKLIRLINPKLSDTKIEALFNKIDNDVIRFMDADDNGQLIEKKLNNDEEKNKKDLPDDERYYTTFDFDFITLFNPSWHDKKQNYDGCFVKAFYVARKTLKNCLKNKVLGEKIKEDKSISIEEQFINGKLNQYKNIFFSNFNELGKVWFKEQYDGIKKNVDSQENKEFLKKEVGKNLDLFLKQHSFKFDTHEQIIEIIEEKIRQSVDEFYATRIIEVLTQNPNNIKCSCLNIPAQTFPWKKGIFAYNEKHKDNPIRFVMYPHPNGGWAIECVQKSSSLDDRYSKITPLVANVPYKSRKLIEFVHKNKFFARTGKCLSEAEAKNALYGLCEKSIKNQNIKKKISSVKLLVGRKYTGLMNCITGKQKKLTDGKGDDETR